MYYDHNNMPVRNGPPWSVLVKRAPKPKWKPMQQLWLEEQIRKTKSAQIDEWDTGD